MRDFTNLSALPGHTIVIDGEAYDCPGLEAVDMQGSVRKVPADRILAVQWHGAHGHGSIEGYGAMEGFADKNQLAPYVRAWLKARANAKAEAVDAILRKKQQVEEMVAVNRNAVAGLEADAEAHTDREEVLRPMMENLAAEGDRMRAMVPTDAQVAAARAEAEAARAEADADA